MKGIDQVSIRRIPVNYADQQPKIVFYLMISIFRKLKYMIECNRMEGKTMKRASTILLIAMMILCTSVKVSSGDDLDKVQGKYFRYNLIPLTEPPSEGAPNYTLWTEAFTAIQKMDTDIMKNPEWYSPQKKESLVKRKLGEYKCNELIMNFNLGQYGNRYFSIFTGPRSSGITEWGCRSWYVSNPRNPKEIWPKSSYPCKVILSITGSTLKGDYYFKNQVSGKFDGTLSDKEITYTLTLSNSQVRRGTIQIISPTYISGKWCADKCRVAKDANGEWELEKIVY